MFNNKSKSKSNTTTTNNNDNNSNDDNTDNNDNNDNYRVCLMSNAVIVGLGALGPWGQLSSWALLAWAILVSIVDPALRLMVVIMRGTSTHVGCGQHVLRHSIAR